MKHKKQKYKRYETYQENKPKEKEKEDFSTPISSNISNSNYNNSSLNSDFEKKGIIEHLSSIDREYLKWSLVGLIVLALLLFLILSGNKTEDNQNQFDNLGGDFTEELNVENLNELQENVLENTERVRPPTPTSETSQNQSQIGDSQKFSEFLQKGNDAFMNGDYNSAIDYYNKALAEQNSDKVYVRLFTIYGVQGNWTLAKNAIDTAIILNPSYTDYWVSKIILLEEKMATPYPELNQIYNEALTKIDNTTKVNLVTSFARVSEKRNLYAEAIALWEYAKALYPQNSVMYDEEITRLRR